VRTKPGHGPPYPGVRFFYSYTATCKAQMPNRPAEYLLTREAVHVFMIQSSLLVPAWLFVGSASMALTASTLIPRAGEWWPRRRGSSRIAGVWRDSVRRAASSNGEPATPCPPNPQAPCRQPEDAGGHTTIAAAIPQGHDPCALLGGNWCKCKPAGRSCYSSSPQPKRKAQSLQEISFTS
jgi:hypothetical protein